MAAIIITVSARRQLVLGMLFSAAVALGSFGPAIAGAAPGVWDIESFDSCTELLDDGINESLQQKLDETKYCCVNTGGVWNEGQQKCEAPPPAAGAGATRPLPPRSPFDEPKVPFTTTTTVRPMPALPGAPVTKAPG